MTATTAAYVMSASSAVTTSAASATTATVGINPALYGRGMCKNIFSGIKLYSFLSHVSSAARSHLGTVRAYHNRKYNSADYCRYKKCGKGYRKSQGTFEGIL